MRLKLSLIALLALAALMGCQKAERKAFFDYGATPAKFAGSSELAKCEKLGEVSAEAITTRASSNFNLAKKNARDNLAQKAGEMGATHVLFTGYLGNRRPVAQGLAYKCP